MDKLNSRLQTTRIIDGAKTVVTEAVGAAAAMAACAAFILTITSPINIVAVFLQA